MLYITKKDFAQIRKQYPDYVSKARQEFKHAGKTCKAGDWCAFEGCITGDFKNGCTLIFQHIHFEII